MLCMLVAAGIISSCPLQSIHIAVGIHQSTPAEGDFGVQEVTGYGLEDIQGQSCLSLFGPESGHKAMRELSHAHLKGHSCRSKMLSYRRDGVPVW